MPTMNEIAGWLEEAADDVCGWAAYADVYYRTKHDLEGDVAKIRARATAVRAMPEQAELLAAAKAVVAAYNSTFHELDNEMRGLKAAIQKATP